MSGFKSLDAEVPTGISPHWRERPSWDQQYRCDVPGGMESAPYSRLRSIDSILRSTRSVGTKHLYKIRWNNRPQAVHPLLHKTLVDQARVYGFLPPDSVGGSSLPTYLPLRFVVQNSGWSCGMGGWVIASATILYYKTEQRIYRQGGWLWPWMLEIPRYRCAEDRIATYHSPLSRLRTTFVSSHHDLVHSLGFASSGSRPANLLLEIASYLECRSNLLILRLFIFVICPLFLTGFTLFSLQVRPRPAANVFDEARTLEDGRHCEETAHIVGSRLKAGTQQSNISPEIPIQTRHKTTSAATSLALYALSINLSG
ncbi:hypothetical protein DFH08DRAFT_796230 [Mycena albidolilacea]|uniref:Uncharacterized protein n=1 Tax=Mycena albidolilacea TaxID=1033008 RepID=A0AAD7AUM1_9AGAR|nr:hypothetical protein DFH08DRAFT_796230 [Mycena albidolilacea]